MKLSFKLIIGLLTISATAFGQDQIKDILKGSQADINYLANGYATPALKAFGFGLNQGWYNTAKPHKVLGFDITVAPSLVSIPTTDLTYNVDNSKMSSISLINSSGVAANGSVPTLLGSDSPVPQFQYKTSTGTLIPNTKFSGPVGLGIGSSLPVPMAQIGLGLPKGFELKVRYIPTTDLSGILNGSKGSVSMIGFGLLHDIKQYIPVISQLPFDLSAFVGYTKFNLDAGLDSSKPDNKATYECSATTVQALISKKFSVITFYGSLGYNFATTTANIKGSYNTGTDPITNTAIIIKDPVSISAASNGPRATAGMRLKLLVFTFHADYTLQEYSTVTGGIGISVR